MHRVQALLLVAVTMAAFAVTAVTASSASKEPPIPASQYAAIVAVMKKEITLDARRPIATRVEAARQACRALLPNSQLVASFKKTCRADVDAVKGIVAIAACRQIRVCVTAVRRYSAAVHAQADGARGMNTTLKAAVPDPPCRAAMRYRYSEVLTFDRLGAAANRLEEALRYDSASRFSRELRRFFSINRNKLQTHRGRLHAFRVACR